MYPDNINNGREMYVEGVSTSKVKDITEELCGTSFSKSLISSLAGRLDSELRAWRDRPLEAEGYPYLFVDARYEKVRSGGRVVSQRVLVVSAVREPDGFREILGVEVADTESEATYQELFRSLKARGLKGVELVVSDDHEGLKGAVERHFQGASWQRCQVHYARNLLGMAGAKKRKELAAQLRSIFAATSREQALGIASAVADQSHIVRQNAVRTTHQADQATVLNGGDLLIAHIDPRAGAARRAQGIVHQGGSAP
jgi:putative transposase